MTVIDSLFLNRFTILRIRTTLKYNKYIKSQRLSASDRQYPTFFNKAQNHKFKYFFTLCQKNAKYTDMWKYIRREKCFLEKLYYLSMIGNIIVQIVGLCRGYDKITWTICRPHPVEILLDLIFKRNSLKYLPVTITLAHVNFTKIYFLTKILYLEKK